MQSFYPSLCEALGENPSDKDYYSPDIQSSDDYSPSETESYAEAEDEHKKEVMLPAEGERPTFNVVLTKRNIDGCFVSILI